MEEKTEEEMASGQRYYRPNYLARSLASLKVFGSKYAQERYYRPLASGTTARTRAVLPPERYYRQPAAVLPALRDGFQPELPPVVSFRPNYYI